MHLPRPVQIVPTAATWARLALIASGLFAAGAAHFAGFLSSLPDTLQPLVATSMAAGFFGTFLFYVASVFVVSRLVAQFFIAGITLLQYVLARFRRLSPVRRVREHLVMLALERWSVRIVQACIFVFIFAKTYLGLLDHIGYRLLVAIGVVFAILALVSLFARAWPFVSLSKVLLMLEGRRRSRLQAALLNSMVTFGVGLVLVLAYLAGEMRQNALWRKNELFVQEARFKGRLNLVLRSGQDLLLVQHMGFFHRYVFVTRNAIFYEIVSTPEGFEEFPPVLSRDGG